MRILFLTYAALLLATSNINARQITVAIPDTSAYPGDVFDLPVIVSEAAGIAGFETEISYDPALLTAISVRKAASTEGFLMKISLTAGRISLALANSKGLPRAANDSLTVITFRVISEAVTGETSAMAFEKPALYDSLAAEIPTTQDDGVFTVSFKGVFGDFPPPPVDLHSGDAAFGDFDRDGVLEILLTGNLGDTLNPEPFTGLFRRDQEILRDNFKRDVAQVLNGAVAWGDFDGDNDLDFALAGDESGVLITEIYRNDNSKFVLHTNLETGVKHGALAWADADKDGDLDLLVTGNSGATTHRPVAVLYRNDNGVFADAGANLTGVSASAVAWGDFDNDGDQDIAISGRASNGPLTRLYRNDDGAFHVVETPFIDVASGSLAWGDFNSDGWPDLLLTGGSNGGAVAEIYKNNQGDFLSISAGLTGVRSSAAAKWGDVDGNGTLDFLATGLKADGSADKLFRSNNPNPKQPEGINQPPGSPANPRAEVGGNAVTLRWDPAFDTETPGALWNPAFIFSSSNQREKLSRTGR